MKNKMEFFKEGIKTFWTTGSLARSSRFLCKEMIRPIDFKNAKTIIELGPGDGVITEYLLENMQPDSRLLAFEVNDSFCDILRTNVQDKRFHLVEDSAEYLEKYMTELGLEQADYIISAIPFAMLPEELTYNVVRECFRMLHVGGLFIQFHYSLLLKKVYQDVFDNVDIQFVPLNIPPAFVMVCKKNKH